MSGAAQPRHWAIIVILGIVWAATFPAIALALEGYRPLTVAAARCALAAAALVPVMLLLRLRPPGWRGPVERRVWLHLLGMAVFSTALPYGLVAWGQQYVASGFAGVSMATVPLFVLPLAHFLVPGEQMTPGKAAGFALGFAGVLVLLGPGALRSAGAELEGLGRLACIAGAASFAVGGIITRLCPPADVVVLSAMSLLLAAIGMVPVALVFEGAPGAVALSPTLWLVYLGVVPTALAILLRVKVTREVGPSFMVLTNYQVPVWAVIMGAVFLGEPVPGQLVAGLALILGGLTLSGRPDRLLRR